MVGIGVAEWQTNYPRAWMVARIDKERRRRGWNRGSVIQSCLENYLPVLEGEVFGKPVLPRDSNAQFPEWSAERMKELAEQEPDCGVWACSPEIFAEMCADAEKENLSEVRKEETPDAVGETVLPEVREEKDAEVTAPEPVVLVDERMKAAETQLVTEIVEDYGKVLRDEFEGKSGGK